MTNATACDQHIQVYPDPRTDMTTVMMCSTSIALLKDEHADSHTEPTQDATHNKLYLYYEAGDWRLAQNPVAHRVQQPAQLAVLVRHRHRHYVAYNPLACDDDKKPYTTTVTYNNQQFRAALALRNWVPTRKVRVDYTVIICHGVIAADPNAVYVLTVTDESVVDTPTIHSVYVNNVGVVTDDGATRRTRHLPQLTTDVSTHTTHSDPDFTEFAQVIALAHIYEYITCTSTPIINTYLDDILRTHRYNDVSAALMDACTTPLPLRAHAQPDEFDALQIDYDNAIERMTHLSAQTSARAEVADITIDRLIDPLINDPRYRQGH